MTPPEETAPNLDDSTRALFEGMPPDPATGSARLTQNADMFYQLVEHCLGLICIHDLTGNLLYVNAAAAASLGYSQDEVSKRSLQDFLAPDVLELFPMYLARIARKRRDSGLMKLVRKNGDPRTWLYRNIVHDDPAAGRVVLGHALDVTDLLAARDALDDSCREVNASVAERTDSLQEHTLVLQQEIQERSRVEEILRRRALTFQHISDGIILCHADGEIVDWNPAAEKMFGYSKTEALGLSVRILDPPGEPEQNSSRIFRELGDRDQWMGEVPFVRKNGSLGIRELILIPIRDDAGNEIAVISVNRDVTERRRAQESLRRSEEQFRLILENASDVVVIVDRAGRIRFASPSVERTLGYRPVEVLGRSIFHFIHPNDVERAAAELSRIELDKGAVEEFSCRHKDCSWRIVEAIGRGFVDPSGERLIALNARDVTERRMVEASLRVSEMRYRNLFEHNMAGVLRTMLSGRILEWNKAFERLLGYTYEEFAALEAPDVYFDPRDRERFMAALKANGAVTNYELCFRHKNRARVYVLANAALVEGVDGGPATVMGTVIDITERKQLEDQLRQSQKMEAIGRLAGGISHDFNNLLTVITGYSELLMASIPEEDQSVAAQVEEIRKAAERASALTAQLLAFSRRQILEPSVFDLNALVEGVHAMLSRMIGEDIHFRTLLHPAPLRIRANAGQIEQVILNLIVNARDAMPGGGDLVLSTAFESFAGLDRETQRCAVLQVSDTGTGMDLETQSRIFEPFFTTKARGKGTGLGLSTVYGIVQQSKGHIQVNSEPGRGSTFRIAFPLAEGAHAAVRPPAAHHEVLRGTETILVVEDESQVRHMIHEILAGYGYSVHEAADGIEALDFLRTHQATVDLILTDVVMPRLGGREMMEHVAVEFPAIRSLYMSGYNEDRMLESGVRDQNIVVLAKPFTPDTLVRQIRQALDG